MKSLYLHNALVSIVPLHQWDHLKICSQVERGILYLFFRWKESQAQNGYVVCLWSQRKWKNWALNESLWTPNLGLSLLPQSLTMKDSKLGSVKRHNSHYRRFMTAFQGEIGLAQKSYCHTFYQQLSVWFWDSENWIWALTLLRMNWGRG